MYADEVALVNTLSSTGLANVLSSTADDAASPLPHPGAAAADPAAPLLAAVAPACLPPTAFEDAGVDAAAMGGAHSTTEVDVAVAPMRGVHMTAEADAAAMLSDALSANPSAAFMPPAGPPLSPQSTLSGAAAALRHLPQPQECSSAEAALRDLPLPPARDTAEEPSSATAALENELTPGSDLIPDSNALQSGQQTHFETRLDAGLISGARPR